MLLPKLQDGLILQEVGDECVGYLASKAKAFCLSPTCAKVAVCCQKGMTEQEAIDWLMAELSVDTEQTHALLLESLAVLRDEGLLLETADLSTQTMPRRQFVKMGTAAAALPFIASVLVPTPASASSQISPLCDDPVGTQYDFVTPPGNVYTVPVVNCGGPNTRVCVVVAGAGGGAGGGGHRNYSGTVDGTGGDAGSAGYLSSEVCAPYPVGDSIQVTIGEGGNGGSTGVRGSASTTVPGGNPGAPGVGYASGGIGVKGDDGPAPQGSGGGGGSGGGTSAAYHVEGSTLIVSAAGGDGGKGGNGTGGVSGGAGGVSGGTGGTGPAGDTATSPRVAGDQGQHGYATIRFETII